MWQFLSENSSAVFVLIGALIGGLANFFSNWLIDSRKAKRQRKQNFFDIRRKVYGQLANKMSFFNHANLVELHQLVGQTTILAESPLSELLEEFRLFTSKYIELYHVQALAEVEVQKREDMPKIRILAKNIRDAMRNELHY